MPSLQEPSVASAIYRGPTQTSPTLKWIYNISFPFDNHTPMCKLKNNMAWDECRSSACHSTSICRSYRQKCEVSRELQLDEHLLHGMLHVQMTRQSQNNAPHINSTYYEYPSIPFPSTMAIGMPSAHNPNSNDYHPKIKGDNCWVDDDAPVSCFSLLIPCIAFPHISPQMSEMTVM